MKIVKEEQNLMVIKNGNIIAFLICVIFVLVGTLIILKPHFFADQPPVWLGLVMTLAGGFGALVVKATTITLDKMSGKMLVAERSLISRNTREYGFDQIVKIELQKDQHISRKGSSASYKLVFVLNNREQISFSLSSVGAMGMEMIPGKNKGVRIAKFLNVPFEERRPLTVNEAMSAIQTGIQNAAQTEIEKQKKE